jgi:DNA-binding SARP family transcriptional activator
VADLRLTLMDGFELTSDGRRVPVQRSSQRLIAYLALRNRPLLRLHLAGVLWLDSSEERSCANLRSALWRLRGQARTVVETDASHAWLSSEVHVDVRDVVALARGLIDEHDATRDDADVESSLLAGDLLPDWYDDWVQLERDRLRELRLHALETLAARATRDGRYSAAIDCALIAIQADPLRESAHRLLIRAYLAEGNPSAGMRQYRSYCRRAKAELGVEPSSHMRELVAGLVTAS